MRRIMKVLQVKRHALYMVIQDGERGHFFVMRLDAEQGAKPRPVGRIYSYEPGNEEEKRKARSVAYAVAYSMAEQATAWMDERTEDMRTLQDAERDFRARQQAERLQTDALGEEPALSPFEALKLDRKAAIAANALALEEQEASKMERLREELSPAGQRRPQRRH